MQKNTITVKFDCQFMCFPVVLMEDLLKTAGLITLFLKSHLTGKYVHTEYQKNYLKSIVEYFYNFAFYDDNMQGSNRGQFFIFDKKGWSRV